MTDKQLEIFTKPNPEAYKRFKRARRVKRIKKLFAISALIWKRISSAILWICAVGGFALSLIQFLQDK